MMVNKWFTGSQLEAIRSYVGKKCVIPLGSLINIKLTHVHTIIFLASIRRYLTVLLDLYLPT